MGMKKPPEIMEDQVQLVVCWHYKRINTWYKTG